MKRALALAVLCGIAATGCITVKENSLSVSDESSGGGKALRHVVLFKFKPGTTDADIEKVRTAFHNLKNGIDAVKRIESGANVSTENLSQGYTHCFIVTFADTAGRDTYLTHPVHDEFVKLAGPHLESALVVDFVP